MQLGKLNSAGSQTSRPGLLQGRNPLWLGALVIALATVAAYWPVFSAGFIWDDDAYVTSNSLLTAPDGWWRIWFSAHSQSQYFPLVYSTLRLEYALWGLNPLGYHAVNVALHLANALLAWALLRRLALPGAWLAAAIFALHPMQVETVGWVTELKNTESTMFYFLALFAWLRFCAGRGRNFYWLALGLHALALFAKTTACTLPAVMLLVLWLQNGWVDRRRVLQVLPFLALGFAMGLVSVWWEKHLGNYAPDLHLLGGPLDRLLIATHAVWFYAGKVFWPAELTFSYPRWAIDAGDWRQYGWLAACLAAVALLWQGRTKLGRGPAAAGFFFVAVLSPMLGFIPLYTFYFSYVADHYQYLACLGLIAGAVAGASRFFARWPGSAGVQCALAVCLLAALGAATWRQCLIYRNLETLWTDTLHKNPRAWIAHTNLGRLVAQRGQFDDAEAHYQAALDINPTEETIYYDYGNLLARAGRLPEAEKRYRQGLQFKPTDPELHNNLGYVLLNQRQPDAAIVEYNFALQYNPDYAEAWYNLGTALTVAHRMSDAVAAYQRAAQLRPDSDLFRRRLQELGATANGPLNK